MNSTPVVPVTPVFVRANQSTFWEPIKSGLFSLTLSIWPVFVVVLGFAISEGQVDTFQHTLAYYQSHWWPILIGLIVNPAPIYRASQGLAKAKSSQTPPTV